MARGHHRQIQGAGSKSKYETPTQEKLHFLEATLFCALPCDEELHISGKNIVED
jgi:hypothetical protein